MQRRRGSLTALGADVRRILAPVLGRKGFLFSDILAGWESIAGDIAGGVYPHSLAFHKDSAGATLFLKAVSGAHAAAATAQAAEIIEKINSFAGYAAVGALKISQGAAKKTAAGPRVAEKPEISPEKRAFIDSSVQKIDSEELKQALKELGALTEE